jgi:lipopolysaccharide/colanic/teichoic acid biosynthesis glycosyltransferase
MQGEVISSGSGALASRESPRAEESRAPLGERVLAALMLLVALPLIALVAIYVLWADGRPVFYRGTRLGRGKRSFQMWKLRTLRIGADRATGGDLLNHRHDLTIRGGRFLRETRLDEFPQLWNIVRGDMSFIGPRPERPEVYATKCRDIPGYERRFEVRPGMIGVSQLFTPHGTPKRYRALIDNGGLRSDQGVARELQMLAFTAFVVMREVARRGLRQIVLLRARLRGLHQERRRLRRVVPSGAVVHLGDGNGSSRTAQIVDMNEETILVECEYEPGMEAESEFVLDVPLPGKSQPARRTARCAGLLIQNRARSRNSKAQMVLRYRALSPRSEYMIHQYFLRDSLATPRPPWSGPVPETRATRVSL